MFPVYGLAEASLAVSFPEPGSMYRYITVDRRSLGVGIKARLVEPADPAALKLMCEGRPIPFTDVKLVDDAGANVPPDTVGHLLIRGDNVTAGYFQNPEANAAAFTADGWLRTGDLALEHEGMLYVTGRSKEIIFVNGQNYYPHDLEAVLQAEPGLELGKVIAVAARAPGAATDELVLFVLHRKDMADFLPLATRAMHLVNEHAGVEVARVVPVQRIPKTTSGKLQRTALAKSLRRTANSQRRSRSSIAPGPQCTAMDVQPRAGSNSSSRPSSMTRCPASTSTSTTTCSTSAPVR